jgi:ketosteroid isomerase-like protein
MWFTETPWPPIFIGIAAMLLLLSAWARKGGNWRLYVAIGLGAACVGVFFFERWYVTELEKVEAEVPKLVAAVEADDVDRVLAFISEDATVIRAAVRYGMNNYTIGKSIRLTDLHARYGADKSTVITHFRANGTGTQKSAAGVSQPMPTRWELTWKKSGDRWKIVEIQRLHPTTDEKMQLLSHE